MNSSEQPAGSPRFSTKPSLKGAVSNSPATRVQFHKLWSYRHSSCQERQGESFIFTPLYCGFDPAHLVASMRPKRVVGHQLSVMPGE
jgi:hypothetical protein